MWSLYITWLRVNCVHSRDCVCQLHPRSQQGSSEYAYCGQVSAFHLVLHQWPLQLTFGELYQDSLLTNITIMTMDWSWVSHGIVFCYLRYKGTTMLSQMRFASQTCMLGLQFVLFLSPSLTRREVYHFQARWDATCAWLRHRPSDPRDTQDTVLCWLFPGTFATTAHLLDRGIQFWPASAYISESVWCPQHYSFKKYTLAFDYTTYTVHTLYM